MSKCRYCGKELLDGKGELHIDIDAHKFLCIEGCTTELLERIGIRAKGIASPYGYSSDDLTHDLMDDLDRKFTFTCDNCDKDFTQEEVNQMLKESDL